MSLRTSSRRRRSHSRPEGASAKFPAGLGLLLTTALLAVILITGPAFLGSDRLWIDLPLCGGVALLLLVQGLRLTLNAPAAGGRPLLLVAPAGVRRIDLIDWTVLLFTAYTVLRWATSPAEYVSRLEMYDVVGYAGIFLTCRYGMANRRYAMVLLYLLVLLGAFETGFGYYLVQNPAWFPFGPNETNQHFYFPRWIGTYGCPNNYGSLLVMAIGAALAVGSFSRLAWPVRIVSFYLAFMMMVGVIYSASRGSWIALVAATIALVIWGLRHGTVRWWVPVSGALLVFGLGLGLFTYSSIARERANSLVHVINSGSYQYDGRVELARDALHIAHDHPLFGTGPNTFRYVHPRYQSNTFHFLAELTHDDYLNCLDDYGLIGFALAMVFVAAVTLKFFRPLDVDSRWQDRVIVATGFAAWGALLVHSFLDFNLHIPANARMLFALTGLALGRFKAEDALLKNWSTVPLAPLGRGLGLAVIVLALGYGAFVTRDAISDSLYEAARDTAEEIPPAESIAAVQRALAYDPHNGYALKFLGDLYRYKASRQKDMEDRLVEGQHAIDAYRQAALTNPFDDTITAEMGRTYDVMRRYPEAYFCYSRAVTQQPYNGAFWYRLGNHYWVRGLLEKAEQAYLISMACPHGGDDSRTAESQLRQLPEMQGVPLPAPGTSPLTSTPAQAPPAPTLP